MYVDRRDRIVTFSHIQLTGCIYTSASTLFLPAPILSGFHSREDCQHIQSRTGMSLNSGLSSGDCAHWGRHGRLNADARALY